MEDTLLVNTLDWLWNRSSQLAFIGMIFFAAIWLAIKINNFVHRFEATERLCNDINRRQQAMEERLSRMEVILIRIETFLSTKFDEFKK